MNGESTQSAKSTSRIRESFRRPAQSIKPSEPTAPTGTATQADARRRPRHPRSPATLAERPSLVRDSVFMSAMVELNFVSQSKLCQSQYRSMRRLAYGQQPPFLFGAITCNLRPVENWGDDQPDSHRRKRRHG